MQYGLLGPRRSWRRTGCHNLLAALVGVGNSLSLRPQDYGFMLSLAGIPWLNERMPQVTAWYSCTKPDVGHCFFLLGAQSTRGRGCHLSPYNPSLSTDLCNIYCSGSEENGKFHREEIPLLQFLSDIGEGSLRP